MVIKRQTGVTLIELTVVLLVLVALAGVVIPYVGGTSSTALCNATDVTMQNVKKVIMERYYLDTLGKFPKNTKSTATDYNLKYLFTPPQDWNTPFDPATQTGWHGAYLQGGFTLDSSAPIYKPSNLSNTFTDKTKGFVNDNLINGDTVILDGWGRPIILQVDCSTIVGCARLVSAGAGFGLGIGEADIETPVNAHRPTNSDDRILYLNAPTPAADVNPACNES